LTAARSFTDIHDTAQLQQASQQDQHQAQADEALSLEAIEEYRKRRAYFPTFCFKGDKCDIKPTCKYVHMDDEQDIVQAAKRHPWNIESDARNAEYALKQREQSEKKLASKQHNTKSSGKQVIFDKSTQAGHIDQNNQSTTKGQHLATNAPVPHPGAPPGQFGQPFAFWPSPFPPDPQLWGGTYPQVMYNGVLYPMTTGWEMLGAHEQQYAQHYNAMLMQQQTASTFQPQGVAPASNQTSDKVQNPELVAGSQQEAPTNQNTRPVSVNDQHSPSLRQPRRQSFYRKRGNSTTSRKSPPGPNRQGYVHQQRQQLAAIPDYGNTMMNRFHQPMVMVQPFFPPPVPMYPYHHRNTTYYDEQSLVYGTPPPPVFEQGQYESQGAEQSGYVSEESDTSTVRPTSQGTVRSIAPQTSGEKETTTNTTSGAKNEDNDDEGSARSESSDDSSSYDASVIMVLKMAEAERVSPNHGELVKVGVSVSDLEKSLEACKMIEDNKTIRRVSI